ncbi:sn-glycerol-3-phosphate ABC transporter ATP-binding protein UgpC [Pseudooceanicola sediminis]|uniref:sn-glycerol-3-phosphate ABC transporter ATP-binding protein UgpC n=1 Tax=Pseudooceanicola sediminis TaxID=2211117 RepID=A0A399J178_9RHOB|nr:sn-glycerol-3-phosphate ABC transporter ATP-binding protein UgpC [Pseudooceanicola sediminis]KAA2313432.1 sn-glycerol-3-phosphate ABC transporter ATP-binding protein UgpC [Puniceibacterium sp. HSS470]RII38289.1 sn-glycerol-3-phosphate ABC transporter ATP-binding protein UgpC [Pseudooceanicola sediminis]|tara:strand:- start:14856 stop:15902 length:1047 start_codon:yes stop_codon:yes gene_type:complete
MATLTLESLGKTYDSGASAVSGINIDVADGEFLVLVGPSGCGKSTLLRMIAGLETVTHGSIRIGPREVNRLEPADRDIAMVFQNYALYPHMSVRENLSYGLRNRRMARAEITRRVEEAARILEIGDFLERKPRALSGGQRQRVAMGRAIVREPSVFLFDEPLSNLDAKLRVTMRGEIRNLQKRLGTTSVYVTHDQLEAMTLADRLVVLRAGKVEQIGTPLEVYQRPASTFVAEFIGSPAMNLLDGVMEHGRLAIGTATMRLPDAHCGPVRVGVRAEDLRAVPGGTQGALPVRLSYVEELGSQRLGHFDCAGARLIAAFPSGQGLSEEMALMADPEALHLFGADGMRLT